MALPSPAPDWEAFYRDYRRPGYVPGFEITSKLGGGAFGLVFRARRLSIGKDYAIKFLRVEDSEVQKAVLAELEQVRLFAQIDHPNLVAIEDRGEVDGIPYLVMAFAGTQTLRDRLTGRPPASAAAKEELLRWFAQACRGLLALHERSLVHFDVKPANVFLKGPVARLGDYGLSRLVTQSRGSLSMGRGTPYYMAPELLQRRGDHRSDIYSAGVVLYEILCGVVPFRGDSEWEVLKQHETAAPAMPAHLLPREAELLRRCLQKDPAVRLQSVHDLLAALGAPAGAGAAPLPGAPPSPPLSAAPRSGPPPLPGAPAPVRRRSYAGLALLAAGGLFAISALWSSSAWSVRFDRTGPRPMRPAAPLPAAAEPAARFVAAVREDVRDAVARGRRTALSALDLETCDLPRDFRVYRQQVGELARVKAWTPGQAVKAADLGRPGFVAAVALLQDLDVEEIESCRRAANLQRLLAAISGIEGLTTDFVGEPGEGDCCHLLAVADGWRRIAVRYATDDDCWQALLRETGRMRRAER
jgi:hypothetical protein